MIRREVLFNMPASLHLEPRCKVKRRGDWGAKHQTRAWREIRRYFADAPRNDDDAPPMLCSKFFRIALPLTAVLLGACGDKEGSTPEPGDECNVGSEGCACTSGGGCDDALSCESDLCVKDGAGASSGGMGGDSGEASGGSMSTGGLGGASSVTGGAASGTGGGAGEIELGTGGSGGPVVECDSSGNCVCIKIAMWGGLGVFGTVPGMDGSDAMTEWLNANSTAQAEYSVSKPSITKSYLEGYDIIILQNLSDWPAFTAGELAAFEAWIRAGGSVMSLAGYTVSPTEMARTNSLLSFSGMSYEEMSDTAGSNLVTCGYCYGNSVPQAGWKVTHPIATHLTMVGAYHGRSILPGTGAVLAETADEVLGATKQVDAGRVFMFHDEWITYQSQWTGAGIFGAESCEVDSGDACSGYGPTTDYSIPQFWYNSVKWLSGGAACFDVNDASIIKW